jgi:transcriptional regulator with XRE-family HTH domain
MQVRLKEWRQQRLLTQEALAEKSGVGIATIARIEAGQGARLSTLAKLAETLDLTPEELFAGPGELAGKTAAAA